MVEESLDTVLPTSYHNAQATIPTFVYNVVKQVMLHMLRKGFMREMLDTPNAKIFDSETGAQTYQRGCWGQSRSRCILHRS